MANTKSCPSCGGKLVPVGERTGGFSAGKAVVGTVVAGPVGAAAGALGKKLITLKCEKCGYTMEVTEKDALMADQYYAPFEELEQDVNKLLVYARFSERVRERIKEYQSQGYIHVPFVEIPPMDIDDVVAYSVKLNIGESFNSTGLKNQENYKKYEELDLAA